MPNYTSVEVCAGAGGQALGLEAAGFDHLACVEWEPAACETLRANRPAWNVIESDLRDWEPAPELIGVDLLAGGVPCPPFSIAGQQLGRDDERDLFPEIVRLAEALQPRALMIENVRGLLGSKFADYRDEIVRELKELGFEHCGWELLNSADYGVPQARRRSILVMMRPEAAFHFRWPNPQDEQTTVGETLLPYVAEWPGAAAWSQHALGIAPALVGGSKKHGGADLGPTRARARWAELGVDGRGLADAPPGPETPHDHQLRLTVPMAAAVQGFPPDWQFQGRKTAAYRQVGNAFPPPVATAVGQAISSALLQADAEED
ncbi:MAG: DNA cytosine methyltransferase [Aeromicrobium sp.]|uniref:DNA cytosine methyltransferase n=1 Tax=Aeromicrobium sp. TaxID=1871063 RepID=UPI0039E5629B